MENIKIGEGTEIQVGEDGKAELVKHAFKPGDQIMFRSGKVYTWGQHNNIINPDRAMRMRKKVRVRLRKMVNANAQRRGER